MELELARHQWAELRTPQGRATALPAAIRALCKASSAAEVGSAVDMIDRIVFANGLLCEASPALAECLVHGLLDSSDAAKSSILAMLADITDGIVDSTDPAFLGPVNREDCMTAIALGFVSYCELLESHSDVRARASCIDLIRECGKFDMRLRGRARHYLGLASQIPEVVEFRDLIANSIAEIDAGESD